MLRSWDVEVTRVSLVIRVLKRLRQDHSAQTGSSFSTSPRTGAPPCRGFTPECVDAYKALFMSAQPIPIVFMSSDKSKAGSDEFCKGTPWLSLPSAERDVKSKLAEKLSVTGIPTLVLLGGTSCEFIATDGRSEVSADPVEVLNLALTIHQGRASTAFREDLQSGYSPQRNARL